MKAHVHSAAVPLPSFALAGRALMVLLLAGVYWIDIQTYLDSASPIRMIAIITAILVPVSAYFFVLVRRFFRTALSRHSEKTQEGAALCVATAVLVPSMHIFGTPVLLVLHVVVMGLLMELLNGAVRLGRWRIPWWRTLYLSSIIPLAGVLVLAGYGAFNIRRPVHTAYTIATEKPLPPGGYTIALVTDLHYGNAITTEDLEADAARIAETHPDLVLLGGDIVDERTPEVSMREAFDILGRIPSREGTYYVYGNHDKALYTSHPPYTVPELVEAITGAGIVILEDQSVTLPSGLTLTGRQDLSDPQRTGIPRASSAALMEGLDPAAFHIMLDHQPRYFEENAEAGYDLMLSGHTHGGQIWPMGLVLSVLDKGTLIYGHAIRAGMDVLVSSGLVGWGYPIRTEGHSEYVTIHLTNDL